MTFGRGNKCNNNLCRTRRALEIRNAYNAEAPLGNVNSVDRYGLPLEKLLPLDHDVQGMHNQVDLDFI